MNSAFQPGGGGGGGGGGGSVKGSSGGGGSQRRAAVAALSGVLTDVPVNEPSPEASPGIFNLLFKKKKKKSI